MAMDKEFKTDLKIAERQTSGFIRQPRKTIGSARLIDKENTQMACAYFSAAALPAGAYLSTPDTAARMGR